MEKFNNLIKPFFVNWIKEVSFANQKIVNIMRAIINFVFYVLLIVFCTSNKLNGQETTVPVGKPQLNRNDMSAEQIANIKATRAKQIELRNAFRETLTGNQLDILTNPALNREEKLTSFRGSLSGTQLQMMKANRKQVRTQNNALRSAVSSQQRMQIRRMGVYRAQQNRFIYQRTRRNNRFQRK